MALLHATASPKPKRKPASTGRASSAPLSLPDSDSLKRIESLTRELTEAKASGEATKQELETLRAELAAAKAAKQKPEPAKETDEKERQHFGSFFGY